MCTSKPNIPTAPPPPPPAPAPIQSTEVSEQAKRAKREQSSQARRSFGRGATFLTGPQGLQDTAQTAGTTLLGQ